jgi:hypothetical protein
MNLGAWSKKLAFALIVVVCATVLAALERITADQWVTTIQWVGGFYIAAAAGVDVVERIKGVAAPAKPKPKPKPK